MLQKLWCLLPHFLYHHLSCCQAINIEWCLILTDVKNSRNFDTWHLNSILFLSLPSQKLMVMLSSHNKHSIHLWFRPFSSSRENSDVKYLRLYDVPSGYLCNCEVRSATESISWYDRPSRHPRRGFLSIEYKTSFHRSHPCAVFLSAKKPMRVVDHKRITKVEKVTSFSVLLREKFHKLRPFDLRIDQHRTPGR